MTGPIATEDYKDIFHWGPGLRVIIKPNAPDFTILDVNDAYLKATNTKREQLLHNSLFSAFRINTIDEIKLSIELQKASLYEAISSKAPHTTTDYRFDIPTADGMGFKERYWTATNTPVLDDQGEVRFIIHLLLNVTEVHKLALREKFALEALKQQRKQLYSIFMQAPVAIGIFLGSDYIVDLINPTLCELYGKAMEEVLGKPIFDVLTHARGRGFEELLDQVRLTGVPFKGQGLTVPITREGSTEIVHLDFIYEPYRTDDGSIIGVIAVATEVTNRVKAEALIEEAEERARLAVDAVGLGTFDLNLETGEIITSATFASIFGFKLPVTRAEYLKQIHPDDRAKLERAHKRAIQTGKLFYEARILWPDQTLHWARLVGKVYYNNDKAIRILGTILDITAQKHLKTQQKKLIALVTNSVDMMAILNLDGTNSYLNQAGKTLLGLEQEKELPKINISQLHTEDDFKKVQSEILPTVMEKGEWSGTINIRQLHSGELIPVFNSLIRIDEPDTGEVIGIGAVMRDLRPEVAAKEALKKSEALLRSITTAAPTGLWQSNENGRITYINDTWVNWTGLPCEEQIGYGWLNAIVREDRAIAKNKFIQALLEKSLYEAEFRIKHVDGSLHWCFADGRPQYSPDGSFTGYIGACVDITEQKLLQQQKDNFIGIASHELKTPVTSLKAYAQVLEKMMLKKGDVREAMMINKMDAQLNRLTNLISDLLDVTKINSGKLQFNNTDFDFNELVSDLLEDLQRTTEKHTLDASLQPTGLVYGDKERIGQVIVNLVTNAIKYSPEANKINVFSRLGSSEITMCVQDFGIGISAKNVGKVFDQFYRVSGDMQHTFPGLGLGLYISSEIIKREGGRMWVDSTESKGSTFCFSIPLKCNPSSSLPTTF
ncbi:MAG: yycG 3 [Pedobacter sp.]|nr:yycG 3 [Pedobacter sp.]